MELPISWKPSKEKGAYCKYVTNLDKVRLEGQKVWIAEDEGFRHPFPLDQKLRSCTISLAINVECKFYKGAFGLLL